MPEVMKLMIELRKRGLLVRQDILTVEEAEAEIKRVWTLSLIHI